MEISFQHYVFETTHLLPQSTRPFTTRYPVIYPFQLKGFNLESSVSNQPGWQKCYTRRPEKYLPSLTSTHPACFYVYSVIVALKSVSIATVIHFITDINLKRH